MNINELIKKYHIDLDDADRAIINKRVGEKGIEEYLNQQLVYLDCSRIIQGMRMMQTIGYPYKREISSYIYALENLVNFLTVEDSDISKFNKEEWINKLIERHQDNLEYEKENPPIWYDGKPKKGGKRKPKAKEGDMFPEETKKAKLSKAEAKLAAKFATGVSFGSFKINKKK